jgi:hypothetical protein
MARRPIWACLPVMSQSRRPAIECSIKTRDAWALQAEYGRSRAFTQPLAWEHVDGWVLITDSVSPDYLRGLTQTGKPIVSLSWRSPDLDCPTILPDNLGAV